MDEMRAQLQPHREITITVKDAEAAAQVRALLGGLPGVVNALDLEPKGGRARVRIDYTGDDDGIAALNRTLSQHQIAVFGFSEETKDLESIFMRVTKGMVT